MAYNKKVWKDRIGTGLDKYLVGVADSRGRKTITSSPDSITQEGDVLNAESMNDLEDRIYNEFENLWEEIRRMRDASLVGGIIFYIDNTSDEVVEFYDSNGRYISNVGIGDAPYSYKVINEGVSGKHKYYIYNPDEIAQSKVWGYYDITTGATSNEIGDGRVNTSTILAIEDTSSQAANSIFVWLKTQRTNKLGGCDDWYIGSKKELEQLRLLVVLGDDDFFTNKHVWSSSEERADTSTLWYDTTWTTGMKSSVFGQCCAIRSF